MAVENDLTNRRTQIKNHQNSNFTDKNSVSSDFRPALAKALPFSIATYSL